MYSSKQISSPRWWTELSWIPVGHLWPFCSKFQAKNILLPQKHVGGAVASWLVRSSPDRAVRVRALAGDIVLCSWARHLTLTVPLSTQVYKWVPAKLMLGVTLRWTSIPSRGDWVEILLVASYYRNQDKLRPNGPLSSYADFTLPFTPKAYHNIINF